MPYTPEGTDQGPGCEDAGNGRLGKGLKNHCHFIPREESFTGPSRKSQVWITWPISHISKQINVISKVYAVPFPMLLNVFLFLVLQQCASGNAKRTHPGRLWPQTGVFS